MKICRRDYCSVPAVPGKNPTLCAEHHEDRRQRQIRTANQPNCAGGCGNKAPLHGDLCNRCAQLAAERQDLHARLLFHTDTLEELKELIAEEILPRLEL